jgi:four helix bundle protein
MFPTTHGYVNLWQGKEQMSPSFRELIVWQRSMQLAVGVYRSTQAFPREELYGLTSQMRRAAVSIASNIAEGRGRLNKAEFRQFLGIARGSNFELQTQIEIAKSLATGNVALLNEANALSHEVGKMLYAILESTKKPVRKTDL